MLASGHYAAVLEVAPNLGIAVGTDGVGSKLILAEQTGRYDTVGIDCVAMNVNDVVCVGAEPIALLDYLAVEQADPDVMEQIGIGLKNGAEQAGVEIPGGEVAILPELIRGHPSPNGFDLTATCFGTVALDQIVTGETIAPGDALIGLPEQRPALELLLARPPRGRRTCRSTAPFERRHARRRAARADRDLRPRRARADPLRHRRARPRPHHRRRPAEPAAPQRGARASTIEDPLPVPPIIDARDASAARSPRPRRGRSSTWAAASSPSCPRRDADAATELLAAHHPGTRRIGTVTDEAGRVAVPARGIAGDHSGLTASG